MNMKLRFHRCDDFLREHQTSLSGFRRNDEEGLLQLALKLSANGAQMPGTSCGDNGQALFLKTQKQPLLFR
jgi:hypothetical protein